VNAPAIGARVGNQRASPLLLVYGAMAGLLAVFIVGILFHLRGPFWSFAANWGANVFEVIASLLCLARAFFPGQNRWAALLLGVGLLGWSLGDVAWSIEQQGGANPPTPSVADGFYLSFYPFAILAVALMIRKAVRKPPLATWLDSMVVGLGVAALTASFAFDAILQSLGGTSAELVTNLSYPIGDLVLLAVVAGGLAALPTWRDAQWLVLILGCALNAVGDIIYVSTSATYQVGGVLDATWPTAILLTSLALWLPSTVSRRVHSQTTPRFWLPAIASLCGLAVLVHSSLAHVNEIAVALASAMLLLALARSLLSFHHLRTLTEAKRLEAITDDLTGLGNRRLLLHVLDELLADVDGATQRLSLLLLDLDHFKEINDSFGHAVGDDVLRMLGPRLRGILRSSDVLTRIGGDEFGIVLTGTDVDHATEIARRIAIELERPFVLEVASVHVSASIGIALTPEHARTSGELLRCADVSMYRAKSTRRTFDIYDKDSDHGLSRQQRIEELREAIQNKLLRLNYQPQYDLHTGEPSAVEALLRWPHGEIGYIYPDEFIPLAEEAGLMKPLTDLVLEEAFRQCAQWDQEGHPISVAVNLSTTNLLDTELPDRIVHLLEHHHLSPQYVVLEITESTLMADRPGSMEVVRRLADIGVQVSIDDFGTGFSSLAYLSDLAVSELKIDGTLIRRLTDGSERKNEAIVRAAIRLSHSLGLRVVAEGVETAETYKKLVAFGCDLAQGYYLARPVPAEEIVFGPSGYRRSSAAGSGTPAVEQVST